MEINFKGSYISTSLIFHIIGPKTNQKVTSPFWSSYPFCFHLLSLFLLISLGDQKREETNQKVSCSLCFSHLFLFLLHLCFTITYKSTRQEFWFSFLVYTATYFRVDRLLRLIMTLPVFTATIERSFSAMKIIKS